MAHHVVPCLNGRLFPIHKIGKYVQTPILISHMRLHSFCNVETTYEHLLDR